MDGDTYRLLDPEHLRKRPLHDKDQILLHIIKDSSVCVCVTSLAFPLSQMQSFRFYFKKINQYMLRTLKSNLKREDSFNFSA